MSAHSEDDELTVTRRQVGALTIAGIVPDWLSEMFDEESTDEDESLLDDSTASTIVVSTDSDSAEVSELVIGNGVQATLDDGHATLTAPTTSGSSSHETRFERQTERLKTVAPAPSTRYGSWTRSSDNPIIEPTSDWNDTHLRRPTMIKESGTYYALIEGHNSAGEDLIGLYWSTDLTNWTEYSDNPVISPTQSWEGSRVYSQTLLKVGNTYHCFYGAGGTGGGGAIGHATSTDLKNWTKDSANPVLSPAADGASWDDRNLSEPKVWMWGDTAYMLYAGDGEDSPVQAGWAEASDPGLSDWSKSSENPVFGPSSSGWDDGNIRPGGFLVEQGKIHTIYEAIDSDDGSRAMGLASGKVDDPTSWTKSSLNPMFETSGSDWDAGRVYGSTLLREGNRVHMLYTGDDSTGTSGTRRIGYAHLDIEGVLQ